MIKTISIIIISVTIFGVVTFILVRNALKKPKKVRNFSKRRKRKK